MGGIEQLMLRLSHGFVPCGPDIEELPQRERLVGRRLDMNHVGTAGMDVQPIETGRICCRVGDDADVGWDRTQCAVVDDLDGGVKVRLRVFELIARDA